MAYSIVSSVAGYASKVQTEMFNKCKTSVLKVTEKIYKPEFDKILVREIKIDGGFANYDASKGFDSAGADANVEWVEYKAENDRYLQLKADAMKEKASYLAGSEPSVLVALRQAINKSLAAEVDAVTMAHAYAASIAGSNTLETSTFKAGAFAQLIDIENKLFNKGIDADHIVYVFIRSDIFAGLEKEIIEKNGLANGAILTTYTVEVPTHVNGEKPLEINVACIKFNNLVLIKMPDDRMSTTVTLNDGRTSTQEKGGYKAGATKMSAVVIPDGCMFTDVRYEVTNMLFPAYVLEYESQVEIDEAVKQLLGDFRIDKCGINQKSNDFEIDVRVIYDSKAYKVNQDKILVFQEE